MSVPFTIGKLIDYFTSPNPVCVLQVVTPFNLIKYHQKEIFMGLSSTTAMAGLLAVFTIGALANAGRVVLLRLAGLRVVSRLRTDAYKAALRQDIDYVERGAGEGDLISRLNVDASIVGERLVLGFPRITASDNWHSQRYPKFKRWTSVSLLYYLMLFSAHLLQVNCYCCGRACVSTSSLAIGFT